MVDLERTRDLFMVAAIFGTFGFAWAGWAQEDPPPTWRAPLGVLSGLSLLVGVAGGIGAWRTWSEPSSFTGAQDGIAFGAVVGVEVVFCLVGAAVLIRRGRPSLVAPWVSLVVGVHFMPLVWFFDDLTLWVPTVAMVVSAVLAWRAERSRGITPSAVTGAVNAPVLLLTAAAHLVLAL